MSINKKPCSSNTQMELELYFLIAKFLENGPCKEAAKALARELRGNQLLPKRVDWEGFEHFRSYESLLQMYRHIAPDHLLRICERTCPILDKELPPNVKGVMSLLGAGRQSLLRTKEDLEKAKWPLATYSAKRNGAPFMPPSHMATGPNIVVAHLARNISGVSRFDQTCHIKIYTKISQVSRSLGHLSAVYCITFDRTGNFIITGSDDHLVKIWSTISGRLLATLRGHSAEIADIAVSFDNRLLATGSCDKTVRVWSLKNTAPVAILHGHSGMITQIQFCPMPRGDIRYLASTGTDGCVCFWSWNVQTKVFNTKPIKFIERSRAGAQMLCASFSPGGVFLATGSSDNVIRVYSFGAGTFEKICELEAHSDRVDSIRYSNHSTRFLSGSKDGSARLWRYERQEWKNVILNMSFTSPGQVVIPEESRFAKPKVTMVTWTCDDEYVITAVTDLLIKVWNSHSGKLLHCMKGHQDEVFVLEENPVDPRILLSAGHDGYVMIWDIYSGTLVKHLYNNIQGQGHGAVFDCKWSPDGQSFSATDSHGFLRYFAFGSNDNYKRNPEEQFFHTDYRPLIRDANDYVLDEQTQQAPHLMPPAFLVNIDGNPHSPKFQRLVPGRERCSDQSLVPQMGVTPSGDREVLDETDPTGEPQNQENHDHIIDHMISHMQQEQDRRIIAAGGAPLLSPSRSEPFTSPLGSPQPGPLGIDTAAIDEPSTSSSMHQVSPQPLSNAHGTKKNISVWSTRICVRALDKYKMKAHEKIRQCLMDEEIKQFVMERKKKPLPPSGTDSSDSGAHMKTRKKQKPRSYRTRAAENEETTRNRLTTRALYDTEVEDNEEEDEDDGAVNIPSDEGWRSDDNDSDSSTEYSDWAADDGGVNLEPPKRRSERKPKKRKMSTSEEEDEETEDEEDTEEETQEEVNENDNDSDFEVAEGQALRRSKRSPPSPKKKARARQGRPKKPKQRPRGPTLRKDQMQFTEITELKEEYRPPEWLSDSIPRKTPYFPQMGDELIYFRQGHGEYIKAVQRRGLYEIDEEKGQPWHRHPYLKEHELVKVVGIKFEFKKGGNGVRLVCLKLNLVDTDTEKFSGISLSVKYHDVPDVLDFLVLRSAYEVGRKRRWKPGDRIRSMIEDSWWFGTIDSQVPFQERFPDSLFLCYLVRWDNGEMERMSPWDFEPINKRNLPSKLGDGVPVTKEELVKHLYLPKEAEWAMIGIDQECDRIVRGLEQIMELSIAEPFLAPVDLQAFPLYAMTIEYPVDLSLVKARLENRFYRRVTAVQFDVRFIEHNAKAFNIRGSEIVRKARLVTELCLRLIKDTNCTDIMPVYNKLVKDTEFALSDAESNESEPTASTSRSRRTSRLSSSRRTSLVADPFAWMFNCKQLVDTMIVHDDSEPFREAVDPDEYPEYYQAIENPMDLAQVKEKIEAEQYNSPVEFNTDMRLVFSNSRNFNTNKRSRIYAMTLRLSAMYEECVKSIIQEWKDVSLKHKGKGKSSKKLPSKVSRQNQSTSVNTRSTRDLSPSHSSSALITRASSRSGAFGSGIHESQARGSQASTSIAVQPFKLPRRAAASRKRFFSNSFEEIIGESDKENQSDSDTDITSEFESNRSVKEKRARKATLSKSAPSVKLVNGKGRYGTRTQTGSAKRKQYNHSDSGDEMESAVTQHRKRIRRKTKTSSEEEEYESPDEKTQSQRGGRALRNKKQSSSDEDEKDSDSETEVDDKESSDAESNEDNQSSDENEEVGSQSVGRGRRGGSKPFPSRKPPPLLSNRTSASAGQLDRKNSAVISNRRRLRSASSGSPPTPQDRSSRSSQRTARGGVSYSQYFDEDEEEITRVSSSNSRRSTRNKQPVTYEEDSEDELEESPLSISSRGRIRKPNSRMRPYLGE